MKKCSIRVLAIDPGLTNTGWVVLDCDPTTNKVVVSALGEFHPGPTADKALYREEVEKAAAALTAEEAKLTERRKTDEKARIEAQKVEEESKAAVITATQEQEAANAEYEAAKAALEKAQNDLDFANQMKAEEDARAAAEKAEK